MVNDTNNIDLSGLEDILTVAGNQVDKAVEKMPEEEAKVDEQVAQEAGKVVEQAAEPTENVETKTEEEVKTEETGEEKTEEQVSESTENVDKDIKQILDEIFKQDEKVEEKQKEVEEQVKKVEETAKEVKDEKLMQEIENLKAQIQEKDIEVDKYKKMAELLKNEYDKLLQENIELKYGGGTDNAVVDVINSDPNLQTYIAYKKKYETDPTEENKAKLEEAARALYENTAGVKLSDLVSQTKSKEAQAFMPVEQGTSVEANISTEGGVDLSDVLT